MTAAAAGLRAAIPVTGRHIEAGFRNRCRICPVALAIRAAFPSADYVRVDGILVSLAENSVLYRGELAAEDQQRIADYDGGKPMVPFTLKITLELAA